MNNLTLTKPSPSLPTQNKKLHPDVRSRLMEHDSKISEQTMIPTSASPELLRAPSHNSTPGKDGDVIPLKGEPSLSRFGKNKGSIRQALLMEVAHSNVDRPRPASIEKVEQSPKEWSLPTQVLEQQVESPVLQTNKSTPKSWLSEGSIRAKPRSLMLNQSIQDSPSAKLRKVASKSVFLYAVGQTTSYSVTSEEEKEEKTPTLESLVGRPTRKSVFGQSKKAVSMQLDDNFGIRKKANSVQPQDCQISRKDSRNRVTKSIILTSSPSKERSPQQQMSERKKMPLFKQFLAEAKANCDSVSEQPKEYIDPDPPNKLSRQCKAAESKKRRFKRGSKTRCPRTPTEKLVSIPKPGKLPISAEQKGFLAASLRLQFSRTDIQSLRKTAVNLERASDAFGNQSNDTRNWPLLLSKFRTEIEQINARLNSFEKVVEDLFKKFEHFHSMYTSLEAEYNKEKELLSDLLRAKPVLSKDFHFPERQKLIDSSDAIRQRVNRALVLNPSSTHDNFLDPLSGTVSPTASIFLNANWKASDIPSPESNSDIPRSLMDDNYKLGQALVPEERVMAPSRFSSFVLNVEDSKVGLIGEPNKEPDYYSGFI